MDQGNEPDRALPERQIPREEKLLADDIEDIENLLTELTDRLYPIIYAPQEQMESSSPDAVVSDLCSVAKEMQIKRKRMFVIKDTLNYLLNNIQI